MTRNRVISVLTVLTVLTLLSAGYAQPVADSAQYNELTNELWIFFNEPVVVGTVYNMDTDGDHDPDTTIFSDENVIYAGLMIDDDNGGFNPDYSIRGGTLVVETDENEDFVTSSNIVKIILRFGAVVEEYDYTNDEGTVITARCWGTDYDDAVSIEGMDQDNLKLWIPGGTIRGTDSHLNAAAWVAVSYLDTPVEDLVNMTGATYDARKNILRFEFDAPVQYDQLPEDIAGFHPDNPGWPGPGDRTLNFLATDLTEDRNENGILDMEQNVSLTKITLTDAEENIFRFPSAIDLSNMDSTALSLELSRVNRANLEQLNLATLNVSFEEYAFVDVNYNPVVPAAMSVEAIYDPDPPYADSAKYDLGQNQLMVWFSHELDPDISRYIVMPKFWIHGNSGDESIEMFVSGGAPGIINGGIGCRIVLTVPDTRLVEDFYFAYPDADFEVSVNENAIISIRDDVTLIGGNGNAPSRIPLEFVEETNSNKAPAVEEAYYDAFTNELYVKFDVRLDMEWDLTGFGFDVGDEVIYLTGGVAERTSANKALSIAVNGYDQKAIEFHTNKAEATIVVDPFSVFQQNKMNGNRLEVGIPVEYREDPNPPLPKYIFYDFRDDRLILETQPPLPASAVDLTKLTFAGRALSEQLSYSDGSDDEVWGDTDRLIFQLTDEDIAYLDAVDDDVKDSVVVSVEAGFLVTGDGVDSEANMDFVDMTMLTAGANQAEVLIGYGRDYYLHAYQVFPSVPRKVHASIRKISDHANWYVANDQWVEMHWLNGVYHYDEDTEEVVPFPSGVIPMRMSEVDSAVNYFEHHTPKYPEAGAYEKVVEIFAGSQSYKIPERIDILFADVYDDYGEAGRNDSKAGYWKHGYFRIDDLPGSEDPLSNDAELIILDTYPQSYNDQGEHVYSWDDNDYEWDDGDLDLTRRGIPAIANLFTEYVTYKIDTYDETWTRKGMAYLSEFLLSDLPEFYGESAPSGLAGKNILTAIGSDYNTRVDYIHQFMFYLYLWEKYGGDDLITALAESPMIGTAAIETVIEDRQDTIDEWFKGKSLQEIYLDFATANLLDTTYSEINDHGVFNFENIHTRASVRGAQLKWKERPEKDRPPYQKTSPIWGFDYFYTSYGIYDLNPLLDSQNDNLSIFAGTGSEETLFRKLNVTANNLDPNLGGTYHVQDFAGENWDDNLKTGTVPMSPGGDWIMGPGDGEFPMWILIAAGEGTFNITNEAGTADYTQLFVAQNPTLTRKVDLYVISELPIYNNLAQEAPMIHATSDEAGTDTITVINLPELYTITKVENDMGSFTAYLTGGWMSEPGTYYWHLNGYYSNGLAVDSEPIMIGVDMIRGGQPGEIVVGDDLKLVTGRNSLPGNTWISVQGIPDETDLTGLSKQASYTSSAGQIPLSDIYTISPSSMELDDPASLTIRFDPYQAGDEDVGICYYRDNQWNYVGGEIIGDGSLVTTRISKFGSYRVMAGDLGDIPSDLVIPSTYALNQNYPNPFNPTTTIGFQLPSTGHVVLAVYDVLGRQVAKLVDQNLRYGTHKVVWNGMSDRGIPLASGIYFVRLKTDSFTDCKKMVFVK